MNYNIITIINTCNVKVENNDTDNQPIKKIIKRKPKKVSKTSKSKKKL